LGRGAGSQSNTNSPGLRPNSILSGILNLDAPSHLSTIQMGRKLAGGAPHIRWGGKTGSPSNTKSPGLRPTSIPSGILMHPAVWPQEKWDENCTPPLFAGRVLGPHLTQSRLGEAYLHAKYQLHPSSRLAAINMGQKFWGLRPPLGRAERGPHLTHSCPGPRPTSIPSAILIHASIWPQQIWAENWGLYPLGRGSWVPT